jgi:hypothetical protein
MIGRRQVMNGMSSLLNGMRRTSVTAAIILLALFVCKPVAAQNLEVRGTITGDGEAYFMQKVGIGTAAPTLALDVAGSLKTSTAFLGTGGFGGKYAHFSHATRTGRKDYALMQHSNGWTFLNSPSRIFFRTGNVTRMDLTAARLQLNRAIKVRIRGKANGWAFSYGGTGYNKTDYHGFGFFGTGDHLRYYYIGGTHASPYLTVQTGYDRAAGNVGIGIRFPRYKLQVNGEAFATDWLKPSSREYKTNIEYLNDDEYRKMLSRISELKVARYRYKEEINTQSPDQIGLISEELPAEVLSQDGKAVEMYRLLTYAIGAMKAQQAQIEAQSLRLEQLEAMLSESRE